MPQTTGSFTYYCAGEDLWMFTCWNASHTSCGTHSMRGRADCANNIRILIGMGYTDRSGQYWDYAAKAWMPLAKAA